MKITLEHTEENSGMKVLSLTFVQPQKVGEMDSKRIDIIRIIEIYLDFTLELQVRIFDKMEAVPKMKYKDVGHPTVKIYTHKN